MKEKSKQKKKRNNDRLYRIIYRIFYIPFRIVAFFTFGVWGKAKKYNEPVLVLSNHTTDLDFMAVSQYIKNHMYFVCSEHVVGMGIFGRFFKVLFHPITVFKGSVKISGVMEIMRRIKQGNSVLLFPEGRLSHNGFSLPLGRATAQLAQAVGCKVVTFRTVGGFFKQPRWQTYLNGGKLFSAGIVNEYTHEELSALSADEVLTKISNDLYVDAYAEQKKEKKPFIWKKGIKQIVRYYCVCPKCHSVDSLSVGTGKDKNKVSCSCGYSMTMDDYGYFKGNPSLVNTPADWERLQNEVITDKSKSGEILSDRDITLHRTVAGFAKTRLKNGILSATDSEMVMDEFSFSFKNIDQMEVLRGGSSLVFTSEGVHYELIRDGACLAKYITLWQNSRLFSGNAEINA